jgi:RNA polymerase sigma factor (sigma-70 family)
MLSIEESQNLMEKLIALRTKANESKSPSDIAAFRKHERLCIEQFSYLVTQKTSRYKSFNNYDDLNQEGFEALLKGMKNYDPKKGCAFWWFHRYIETRIFRNANLHTTIRYPLRVAKATPPHKESIMPILIEEKYDNIPDKRLEVVEDRRAVRDVVKMLNPQQQSVINLAYGFDGSSPLPPNKICKKLGISKANCLSIIQDSLALMREHIQI